jgi:transposase
MAQSFIACDREQAFLMPPDVRDWLPEGHLAWFVIDAVERMDLAAFYAAYRSDGRSRPAYEPSMMVALLLYAYARGVRSARTIERACEEDVAYRVIAAQQKPDHATISRFVERHERALAGVFGSVLGLCAQAGLVRVGVVAIDGTKLHANASRDATVDYERIAREILEEAKAVDAAEDELYGEARGDELPPPSLRPLRAGASGCARRSVALTTSGPSRRGRSRVRVRRGCRNPSGAWRKSCRPSARPTRRMRPTGRAG